MSQDKLVKIKCSETGHIRFTRKNRKTTEGVSTWLFVLTFLSYALWTIYGILQNDWVVYLGQGLGVVTAGIILFQVWIYRNKK
jgi:uncharacterized protein with PQ loop repeat